MRCTVFPLSTRLRGDQGYKPEMRAGAGGILTALSFQVLSVIDRPCSPTPWSPTVPSILEHSELFHKNNTVLYHDVGDVSLEEFVVKGEQRLYLSAKHNSHAQSLHKVFCEAHSSKPQHRWKLKYKIRNREYVRGKTPPSERIHWVLLYFWRRRKKQVIFHSRFPLS